MGIIKALSDSIKSTLADQWKEIIIADTVNEHTLVTPGIVKTRNANKGTNTSGSDGIISNGSKIFVPENMAAFILNQASIENIIPDSGIYEYLDGDKSIFDYDGLIAPIAQGVKKRFGFGGITPDTKRIAYVNLREIRDIKFGSHGPLIYTDPVYGVDLEFYAYGSFSIQIVDPERFMLNYVPANTVSYSIDEPRAKRQVTEELLQSFSRAVGTMSNRHRFSELSSLENDIIEIMSSEDNNVGTWEERFGFKLVRATISHMELSDLSKELIQNYSSKKLEISAYNDISQKTSDVSAQQKIADGIKENGLGDMGNMIFGFNMASLLNSNVSEKTDSIEKQLETARLLKEAYEQGIITLDEYEKKKKEVLGL